MKLKLSAAVLALALGAGAYAVATGVINPSGKDVIFQATWYTSDYERRTKTGAYHAGINWYIAPGIDSDFTTGVNGRWLKLVHVDKPGHYTARLSVTTGAATKLNCKITAGGKTRKEPPGEDKNPGIGKCNVSIDFVVAAS